MDFKEYLIKRNKSTVEVLLSVLLYLAALVISFLCLMIIPPLGGINFLAVAGCFFGAYKLSAKFNREYEYIVTKDTVDIDVIYNASSRKRLISFSVKEIEVIASVDDDNSNYALTKNYSKVIDATTNRKNAEVYFAVIEKDNKMLIKFEPPYAMLEILKKYEPRKVIINEK